MPARNRSHRLTRLLAAGVTAVALAAPPAVARPIDDPELNRSDRGATVVVEPEAPVVQKIDDGFDWDSAAVGAGGAGALLVVVALGGVTYAARHRVGAAR